jgi:hypothetical protein
MNSTTTTPITDHRRMKRRPVKKTVSVTCRKGMLGPGPNLAVRLRDISEDGVQLVIKSALAKGDVIEICFSATGLPSNLSREATVAWCSGPEPDGFRIGARFRNPLGYEHIFQMT